MTFPDEARFGRRVRFRRGWAPVPLRPAVCNGYAHKFTDVYGAVSPLAGQLHWHRNPKLNTSQMNLLLAQVSAAHPEELIVRVLDGASSHKAKELRVPETIRWVSLPPYSPELNPREHVWDALREKAFPNRVLGEMDQGIAGLNQGLGELSADAERIRSLTAWPWIVSLNLIAN